MAHILDVIKNKIDGGIGAPSLELSMAGANTGSIKGNTSSPKDRMVSSIDTANYARERAAAAKAQIEARKAMEESRKSSNDNDKNNNTSNNGLKAPIKRPPALSINRAQYLADQRENTETAAEKKPVAEASAEPKFVPGRGKSVPHTGGRG